VVPSYVIEGTFRITVRPVGASAVFNSANGETEQPNGAEQRGRGRPSFRPKILALVRDLARFRGNRMTLNEVTSAAIERGILQPLPEDGASSFGNRRLPSHFWADRAIGCSSHAHGPPEADGTK
jgi:hypothetical protein